MNNPTTITTTTTTTTTTTSSVSNSSPEFEFWMPRNPAPSSQQTTLHSADQLFSDGILLPFRHLTTTDQPPQPQIINDPTNTPSSLTPHNNIHTYTTPDLKPTSSKRWKDIFKKHNTPSQTQTKDNITDKNKNKKHMKDVRNSSVVGPSGTTSTELNINIWPFSRSRSAGNNINNNNNNTTARPRTLVGNRKASSAPCSRSNSTGDNKYKRWPSSPVRPGVHLGRSSPVWKAKRFGNSRSLHDTLVRNTAEKEKVSRPTTGENAKVVGANGNINVNIATCIGYRRRMGCRSDVSKGGGDVTTPVNVSVAGGGEGGGLFNLRGLFAKKVF